MNKNRMSSKNLFKIKNVKLGRPRAHHRPGPNLVLVVYKFKAGSKIRSAKVSSNENWAGQLKISRLELNTTSSSNDQEGSKLKKLSPFQL